MPDIDYANCHIEDYMDEDHNCLDYADCEKCPYYYEDEE